MSPPQDTVFAQDGAYRNAVSGAGTAADTFRALDIVSTPELDKTKLDTLVDLEWGCRRHVESLPEAATRKGFELTRMMLVGEKEAEESATKGVQNLLKGLQVSERLRQATVWDRHYGGAILIAHVNDGKNASEPLDLSGKNFKLLSLEVRGRHEVEVPKSEDLETDVSSAFYGQPKGWRLKKKAGAKEDVAIHASRVYVWRGWQSKTSDDAWSWGKSVLQTFEPAWAKYRHGMNETSAALPRLAETRWGRKGLKEALGAATEKVKQKFRAYAEEVALIRSSMRILFHDEDETITDASLDISKAVPFLSMLREDVAGAAKVSVQQFFGTKQEGLSNNDETGAEREDADVTAFQNKHIIPALDWLTPITAAHLGLRLESWVWAPKALREETPEKKAKRQLTEAQRDSAHIDNGVVHENEIRGGLKAGDLPYVWSEEWDESRSEPVEEGEGLVLPDDGEDA